MRARRTRTGGGRMAAGTVEVKTEVFGGSAPLGREGMPAVELDLAGLEAALQERVTVGELIGRVVEQQIRELLARRRSEAAARGDDPGIREVIARQYLTVDEIRDAIAEGGAVAMPSEGAADEGVDVAEEVARARRAFSRGAFFVVVDGRQVEALDDPVEHGPGTEITFLRVMPLVGG